MNCWAVTCLAERGFRAGLEFPKVDERIEANQLHRKDQPRSQLLPQVTEVSCFYSNLALVSLGVWLGGTAIKLVNTCNGPICWYMCKLPYSAAHL